ncbi:apical endosomal glycoprotein isoform X2 [Xenopus laevis]|uniref:Apical endosomal glycoprotein isoform X2 n=1 Tax=Xenopus laevis TaxID=8355 RepID=A0A8J1LPX7_XENLA|nr:apical endosomal glycoprotein isoform X2 [Xenopus laevis]
MYRAGLFLILLCLCCSGSQCNPEKLCNFVCDHWDCSDENHCGYHKESSLLGRPFSCDFEQDDCGWTDVSTSSYQWVRERRTFSRWGIRPHGDHTLRNRWGWFMATGGHTGKSAATASLQSPVLRNAAATCEIHIHYHMWAEDAQTINGSLSVQLTDNNQTYNLWVGPKSSIKGWRQTVIYPGSIRDAFQIIVVSSRDPFSHGDIAIDDLEFRHCGLSAPLLECPAEYHKCPLGPCVMPESVCDGTDDCGDNTDETNCTMYRFCNFEVNSCQWNTDGWQRVNGTGSRPSRDHTSGSRNGYFLKVENGSSAKLSFRIQPNNGPCYMVLYYVMDGSDDNRLLINYTDAKKTVAEKQGQRGQVWLRERVQLPDTEHNVTIEGIAGAGPDSVVALDDVILSPGCRLVTGTPAMTETVTPRHLNARAESFKWEKKTCQNISEFLFNSSMAEWTDLSIGRIKWGTDNGTLTGGDTKKYLGVQRAQGNLLAGAEILSPTLCAVGPICAINMTYYFNSGPSGALSLSLLNPEWGTQSHVWGSQGESSTVWRSVMIPVGERKQPFQLVLDSSVDPQLRANWGAAVEKIQFIDCGTDKIADDKATVTCNFETGMCGWYQDLTDDIDWTMGAQADHTTGKGNCLYVEGGSRMDRGMVARLLTYRQSAADSQCLTFYYRVWGPDAGTLILSSITEGKETLLWTSTGTHGNRWHHESVTLTAKSYQLAFDAVRDGSVGNMAVDDITLRPGACAAPTRCTFEAGTCRFKSQGQYIWKLQQNQNANPSYPQPGPFFDHTLQSVSGHYMLVDTATLPRKASALLESDMYDALPVQGCVTFWTQFGGSQAGTLNVYIVEDTGKKKEARKVLSASGMHQDIWHYRGVTIQAGTRPWQLRFEAVSAGGDQCYIALDDIHISHHPCHEPATCDFESGYCGWSNVRFPLVDTYDWDYTSGGPMDKDHTLGTKEGHYAFVETGSLHTEGSSAWLLSEHLPATASSCFSFWYGTDATGHYHVGELVLFMSSTQGLLPIWVLSGHQSNGWQEQRLQLNSTVDFQLVFEASKGSRPHSATVALDDLKYTRGRSCNAKQQEPETKKAGKNNSGTILAVLLGVLLVLLCGAAGFLLYRKRKNNLAGAPSVSSHADRLEGFDNVVFEDNGASS